VGSKLATFYGTVSGDDFKLARTFCPALLQQPTVPNLTITGIVPYLTGMLAVPDVEVPCHILSQNAFNSTSSPANSTELVKCCQQTFTR